VANASGGAHAVAPSGDRGRQRLRHPVRLPQPKGAGGQVAADCMYSRAIEPHRVVVVEAVAAKNRDIQGRERQRELCDPSLKSGL